MVYKNNPPKKLNQNNCKWLFSKANQNSNSCIELELIDNFRTVHPVYQITKVYFSKNQRGPSLLAPSMLLLSMVLLIQKCCSETPTLIRFLTDFWFCAICFAKSKNHNALNAWG